MKFLGSHILSLLSYCITVRALYSSSADYPSSQIDEIPVAARLVLTPRIVNGRDAHRNQFPYQVSLRFKGNHFCGGSIISRFFVLTAGHCVTDDGEIMDPLLLSIQAGSENLLFGGDVIKVSEVIRHPQYDFPDYDIALLKLVSPLKYSKRINAIELAEKEAPSGAKVVASGWGYLFTDGFGPEILQYVHLKAKPKSYCSKYVEGTLTLICLSHPTNKGICQGDSGGPAAYKGTLIGVTSFTLGDCGTDLPDGFTSVVDVLPWIKKNSDYGTGKSMYSGESKATDSSW